MRYRCIQSLQQMGTERRMGKWQETVLGWVLVGLVTSEVDKRSLPKDRRSKCSESRFIRGSGGL